MGAQPKPVPGEDANGKHRVPFAAIVGFGARGLVAHSASEGQPLAKELFPEGLVPLGCSLPRADAQ